MDRPTFDELKDLAHCDPEGFERLRAELIDDCIRRSPERNHRRLRGHQFVIDARRRLAGSPMKALLEIQGMMYESILGLQQVLLVDPAPGETSRPARTRILPFRKFQSSGE